MKPLNIAVVGGGIAGLSAAWLLSRKHRVTLFEKAASPGGHANTVDVATRDGPVAVDTGFIVFNERNYPNLCALFEHLDVGWIDSVMSFSLTRDNGRYEYGGSGANCFFGQRRNVVRTRHWSLLKEINRFFRHARTRVAIYHRDTCLGAFLSREGYSSAFVEDHILPMGAAIWSSSAQDMLDFPARHFIEFYDNHGMLQFRDRPLWRTVRGGSRTYVNKLIDDARLDVRTKVDLRSVVRKPDRVMLETSDGVTHLFDQVVLATHADQALGLLCDADPAEKAMLAAFPYQRNIAILHRDPAFMPRRRRLWSSWNYIQERRGSESELCVTYWMNRLQNLASREDIFVTLNPKRTIAPHLVDGIFEYDHPVYTAASFRTQERFDSIQGHRRTWYCGSYLGYGFHEDGIASGLAVAEQLGGVARPWRNDAAFIENAPADRVELQVAE